jgi:hypothetical protein
MLIAREAPGSVPGPECCFRIGSCSCSLRNGLLLPGKHSIPTWIQKTSKEWSGSDWRWTWVCYLTQRQKHGGAFPWIPLHLLICLVSVYSPCITSYHEQFPFKRGLTEIGMRHSRLLLMINTETKVNAGFSDSAEREWRDGSAPRASHPISVCLLRTWSLHFELSWNSLKVFMFYFHGILTDSKLARLQGKWRLELLKCLPHFWHFCLYPVSSCWG